MCTIRILILKGFFFFFNLKIKDNEESPDSPVVRTQHIHCRGSRVSSLVGELRPHKPCDVANNNNKRTKKQKENLKISR